MFFRFNIKHFCSFTKHNKRYQYLVEILHSNKKILTQLGLDFIYPNDNYTCLVHMLYNKKRETQLVNKNFISVKNG